ncbi:hypothetical protein K1719_044661 [Acacia pycnantha]|nr:hypothetical protein K1719_044661 [Acacia pycnantha]
MMASSELQVQDAGGVDSEGGGISDHKRQAQKSRLNLGSFITTWMESECDKLIMSAINMNYIDMDEYLATTELQASFHLLLALIFIFCHIYFLNSFL